jgi:hypothetical protein
VIFPFLLPFIYNTATACFPISRMARLDYPHADEEWGRTWPGR